MNETEKLKLCAGCHNDYYNHGNNSTTGRCWFLAIAKPVMRTLVGFWQNPPYKWSPQQTLSCHTPDGRVWIDYTDPRIEQQEPTRSEGE